MGENDGIYSLVIENGIIKVAPSGRYSLSDVQKLISDIISNEKFDPQFFLLIDLNKVKYVPIVREIVDITNYLVDYKRYFQFKNALIISREPLHSLCKLAAVMTKSNGLNTDVFCSLEEALAWFEEE